MPSSRVAVRGQNAKDILVVVVQALAGDTVPQIGRVASVLTQFIQCRAFRQVAVTGVHLSERDMATYSAVR